MYGHQADSEKLSISIPRRPADPRFLPGHTFLDLLDNLRCNLLWTSIFVTGFLTCNRFSGGSAFFDHLAFELRRTVDDISSICFQKNNRDNRMLHVIAQSYSQTVFIQKKIK